MDLQSIMENPTYRAIAMGVGIVIVILIIFTIFKVAILPMIGTILIIAIIGFLVFKLYISKKTSDTNVESGRT